MNTLCKYSIIFNRYDHVKLFQLKIGDIVKRKNWKIDHSQLIGKYEYNKIILDEITCVKIKRPSLAEFIQHWRRGVVTPSAKVNSIHIIYLLFIFSFVM